MSHHETQLLSRPQEEHIKSTTVSFKRASSPVLPCKGSPSCYEHPPDRGSILAPSEWTGGPQQNINGAKHYIRTEPRRCDRTTYSKRKVPENNLFNIDLVFPNLIRLDGLLCLPELHVRRRQIVVSIAESRLQLYRLKKSSRYKQNRKQVKTKHTHRLRTLPFIL